MPGYNKFKAFLVERGIQQKDIAELISMSRSRLNLILNGKRDADFTGKQIEKICNTYAISADDYFFYPQGFQLETKKE